MKTVQVSIDETKKQAEHDNGTGGVSKLTDYSDVLYFHSQVTQESAHEFIRKLKEAERALKKKQAEMSADVSMHYKPTIEIYLNSFGGYLFQGFAIADAIKACPFPTRCVVQGIAASAGSLIALAANETVMSANSVLLIHQFSTFFYGTYEQWKDDDKLNKILIARMIDFYVSHTKLDAQAVEEILKHDYWMDAQEALEKGFIQKIEG